MKRLLLPAVVLALAVAAVGASTGCSAVRRVRDPITGDAATATPTFTPTQTPTVTPTSTPTATPTPSLPPNPQGLTRWDALPVPYCVSAGDGGYVSSQAFIDAVLRAFAAWGVPVTDNGACGPPVQDDGVNEIAWGALASGQRLYEAGLTQTVTSRCRANCNPDDPVRLTEADITIDTAPPAEFRNATCLYSALLHETGHFLGLDHLPPPAVMQAETSGCPTRLTAADRQALLERYGARASPQ